MDFGKKIMTKAMAWAARVGVFFSPRRSRVINPDEGELRKAGVFPGAGGRLASCGAAPPQGRPYEGESRLRGVRAIMKILPFSTKSDKFNGLIPRIHAFFRPVKGLFEGGKRKYQTIENKRIIQSRGAGTPGKSVLRGRGVCPHPPAFAPGRGGRESKPVGPAPPRSTAARDGEGVGTFVGTLPGG